jgi:hypothetical protein
MVWTTQTRHVMFTTTKPATQDGKLPTHSAELRFKPKLVKSVPKARDTASLSELRIMANNPMRPNLSEGAMRGGDDEKLGWDMDWSIPKLDPIAPGPGPHTTHKW